ncbi:MAG TPA: Hsp20/alpha crystallin family protein [Lacipirellulaceae bacterium]|nr:Hsp20/alpha crystallin family protein [Lacipirellulaceae bacterium]
MRHASAIDIHSSARFAYRRPIAAVGVRLDITHLFLIKHGTPRAAGFPSPPELIWQPAVDVYRCAQGWLIKVELAGVRPEDVHIESTDRGIVVSGIRRDVQQFEWQRVHLMEIAYSRFERSVQLPERIDGMQTLADFRDGMLYVRVLSTNKSNH